MHRNNLKPILALLSRSSFWLIFGLILLSCGLGYFKTNPIQFFLYYLKYSVILSGLLVFGIYEFKRTKRIFYIIIYSFLIYLAVTTFYKFFSGLFTMQMVVYTASFFCLLNALILKGKSHWMVLRFVIVSISVAIAPVIVFSMPVHFENDFFGGFVLGTLSILLMTIILIFGIRWALSDS